MHKLDLSPQDHVEITLMIYKGGSPTPRWTEARVGRDVNNGELGQVLGGCYFGSFSVNLKLFFER